MNVVDEEVVRRRIQQKLGGPGCLHGYRAMWHVPRSRSFVDRCLRRARNYVSVPSPNSNYSWHIDGYAKLKRYRYPVYGPIATRSQSCKESLEVTQTEE